MRSKITAKDISAGEVQFQEARGGQDDGESVLRRTVGVCRWFCHGVDRKIGISKTAAWAFRADAGG